ncbi:MAG: aminoacyl-tRNA hydrolase [Burkholderiaceae bacterium]
MSSTPIQVIAGLGNPGDQYEQTRHNAGFWFADRIAQRLNASFAKDKSFNAMLAKAKVGGRDVFIIKPLTFMNLSGQSVAALLRFYKLTHAQLLVAHDELDFLPGVIKLKKGGGTAGHNGLKSMQAQLSTPDWWRLRIGIGHPRSFGWAQDPGDFALSKASREHQALIDTSIDKALDVMPDMLAGDTTHAMKLLHTEPKPDLPKPAAPVA